MCSYQVKDFFVIVGVLPIGQPTFTYGPKSNSTMVRIQAKGLEYSDDSPSKQVKPTHSTRVEVMDLTPI